MDKLIKELFDDYSFNYKLDDRTEYVPLVNEKRFKEALIEFKAQLTSQSKMDKLINEIWQKYSKIYLTPSGEVFDGRLNIEKEEFMQACKELISKIKE